VTIQSSDTANSHQQPQDEGRFLVAVGAIIEYVPTRQILLLKRAEQATFLPGIWEDIGGRIKQFEEPKHALRREVQEESGLEIEIVRPINVFHLFHGERSASDEMIIITYWCRTHSDRVVISDEHSDYRWLQPQDALQLVEHEGVRSDIEAYLALIAG
jgi:8-oxo-dGTP diphosphatase